jgi:ubiquinone/menaquinone biosynthesis C-methylase UbiE
MPFPIKDNYWLNALQFLQDHINNEDKIIANNEFVEKISNTIAYSSNWNIEFSNYQWVVIHKGMMNELEYPFLVRITKEFIPVFANEVFVIFSKENKLSRVDIELVHWKSFVDNLKIQEESYQMSHTIFKKTQRSLLKMIKKVTKSELIEQDHVTANPDYSNLSVANIKQLMDKRYKDQNAYNIECLWDNVRTKELTRHIIEAIFPSHNSTILEIGCGSGGSASYIGECKSYIGTDISEVAISQANLGYGKKPNFKFIEMDAMKLQFKEDQFDVVIAREVIEHLPTPIDCLKEAFRVLKSGGMFVVTSPNRDSLHLRVNRMLGYQDFKCSFDHVKEFTFQEAVSMLTQVGFEIKDTKGAFLMPYWGINNVDSSVRHLTDNDPIMLEMLRELGDRAGAEYAFCFIIICIKP